MSNSFLSRLFHYVILASAKHGIDDSHGLRHSMEVLHYADKIYKSEVSSIPLLKNQDRIIYAAAVLHDMCDKKYMNEGVGIYEMDLFLQGADYLDIRGQPDGRLMNDQDINVVKQIVSTMSYSKVKRDGFPYLGPYQTAYHIVREADLLSAYDFDRSMIYNMNVAGVRVDEAYANAKSLFETRVLKHNEDGLFLFDYSIHKSQKLHHKAVKRITDWNRMLKRAR